VRLGYGGGYYDAFIKQHPSAEKVAYCFDFQIVRETPSEEWDERADIIVTDKRVVRVENTSNI
jgi:5-formyltetrahydrofolate cyclo-ligase